MFIHSPTVGPRFGRLLCVCWPLKNTTDQPGHKKISKLCDPFFPEKKIHLKKTVCCSATASLAMSQHLFFFFFLPERYIYFFLFFFLSLSLSRFSFSSSVWTHLAASRHIPPLFSRLVDSRVCVDSSSSVNGSLSWLRWCRAGQSRRCRALSFSFSGDSLSVFVCLDFRQPVSTVVLPWGRSQEGRKKRDKVYLNRKMGSD